MSKRLTLSERFDGLSAPKYDDMAANEEYADDVDADGNNQSNGDTTFTVVSRATGSSSAANSRSQRISHVVDPNKGATSSSSSSSDTKYGPSRATGTRNFRRPLNPNPYSPIKSQTQSSSTKSQFHTNRRQQDQTRTDNYQTNHNNPRFGGSNFNNRRGIGQNRGDMPRRKNNQGMNMNMNNTNTNTGMRGPRTGATTEGRYDARGYPGSGLRGNFANRGGGEGAGRKNRGGRGGNRTGTRTGGRGGGSSGGGGANTNRMRNTNKNDLSEQQLDKELEKYYATNDPKKLNDMKNEELDREMDDYWTVPEGQPSSNGDVDSKKTSKATTDQ